MKDERLEQLIKNAVFDYFKITPKDYKIRKREYVIARQVCMYLFIKKMKYSTTVAGAVFGKNHATAIHAKKTIENLCFSDKDFNANVLEIKIKANRIIALVKGLIGEYVRDNDFERMEYLKIDKNSLIDVIFMLQENVREKESEIERLTYKLNSI